MEPLNLDTNNLIKAISFAINIAKEKNKENFNSVVLRVYENSTFTIVERCYSNSISSGRREGVHGTLDFCDITISKNTYPVADKPFNFLVFCVKYQINIE